MYNLIVGILKKTHINTTPNALARLLLTLQFPLLQPLTPKAVYPNLYYLQPYLLNNSIPLLLPAYSF